MTPLPLSTTWRLCFTSTFSAIAIACSSSSAWAQDAPEPTPLEAQETSNAPLTQRAVGLRLGAGSQGFIAPGGLGGLLALPIASDAALFSARLPLSPRWALEPGVGAIVSSAPTPGLGLLGSNSRSTYSALSVSLFPQWQALRTSALSVYLGVDMQLNLGRSSWPLVSQDAQGEPEEIEVTSTSSQLTLQPLIGLEAPLTRALSLALEFGPRATMSRARYEGLVADSVLSELAHEDPSYTIALDANLCLRYAF